ncbi:MFS transporter [Nonomuraea sp. NPDC049504]|uniref:MFS transporter n=1 Tax=Nonomuraea sp. NPDC049504 TaxID=3154729 RepID=UPI00341B25F4
MRFSSSGSPAVRPFLIGMFVDALGSGLYVPLTLLFIQQVTGLPPATVGLGVTVAAGLGLAANPVAGVLIDRFDARTVLVGTYVIRALGFAVYPLVDGFGPLIAIAAVIAAGDRAYYPASSSYVAAISEGGGRDRLYATQATARNVAFGLGGLLSASAVSLAGQTGFTIIALLNAASFALAATCLLLPANRLPSSRRTGERREEEARSPRQKAQPSGEMPDARRAEEPERDKGADARRAEEPVRGEGADARRSEEPAREEGAGARGERERSGGGYRRVLRDRPFMGLVVAEQAFTLAHLILSVGLPLYAVTVLELPPALLGVLYTVNTLLVAAGQMPVRHVQRHARRTHAMALAGGVFVVACGLYAVTAAVPAGLARVVVLVAATLVFTLAELLHTAPAASLAAGAAPTAMRGRYLAIHQMTWAVGQVVAPAGFSALVALSPPLLWAALGTLLALAAAGLLRLAARLPAEAVSAPAGTRAGQRPRRNARSAPHES